MNILNIKLASVEQTDLGFEHWIDVTYQAPILKNEYTVKLLLLFDFEIEDDKVIEYLVTTWKYRDLVLHSVRMYEMEREGAKKGQKSRKPL
ncbi:hypothetical protein HMPREF2628_00335 [Streptococcus sp. HMSC063B03]|uniref:DUF7720 family protein n=1 Tax=Streptococcus sp. HMSC063B03 TaxID=1715107 RepID=UPI0008A9A962|nr:hypothetical protein [Streptococcus sp. HMSC063B03]OHP91275.1 hypothetical protein HMPREF2628_00335 [Streptococcus sp. HMSC063B03]DAR63820.1 MAG TPA: hypothetical protein [Caudoviricetes sp.]